jgi:hypothetical protein
MMESSARHAGGDYLHGGTTSVNGASGIIVRCEEKNTLRAGLKFVTPDFMRRGFSRLDMLNAIC